tara:strand:- start:741 stop:1667 length:927 start_codon:yes stop_codon:yes gene_type:complete
MSYVLSANTPPPIIIHLDSRFATQYLEVDSNGKPKTTNFIYVMKEPITVPDHMNLLVSLHTATIPYSFYNVRTGVNDKIYYEVAGVAKLLTLDAGNYSATGLASVLDLHIEANSAATSEISYSRQTLKFGFTITGVASFNFKFNGQTDGANELLGIYEEDFNIPIGVETLSDKAIDLNDSIHGLYIRQNIATKGCLDNEEGTFSNILERLPITTNAGGIIFFNSSGEHATMVSVPAVQTIGIKLTDDRNRAIDLNGLHFQLSLKIAYIHKEKLRAGQPRRYDPTPQKVIDTTVEEKPKIRNKSKKKNK